ncbi:MAG: helix-turn-helix domain-containing protein [Bacteroidales bacterium]|nr:helix-turn-helix domain-containing protein [Bacteroidales bacterium]
MAYHDSVEDDLDVLSQESAAELLERADRLYDQLPDSALVCYTVVANRYQPSLKRQDKELCLKAELGKWELIFFNYFDYTAAFDALENAERIKNDLGIIVPRIPLYLGSMYQTAYEQTQAEEPGKMALDYFRDALRNAIDTQEWIVARMAFDNSVEMAHSLGCLNELEEDAVIYYEHAGDIGEYSMAFDKGYYSALRLMENADYESALIELDSIEPIISPEHIRYIYTVIVTRAEALIKSGKGPEALRELDRAEKFANEYNMRDAKLDLYRLREECFSILGKNSDADRWHREYVMLKDSLLNYRQVEQLSERKFLRRMTEMEHTLAHMHTQRQRQHIAILSAIIIMFLVGCSAFVLYRKNRYLSEANRALYQKTVEMLRSEENNGNGEVLNASKYRGSNLTSETKEDIWNAINAVLKHNDEILSPDFSLARLAELAGSKEKYVSQVINERGCNFNMLMNDRRIDEACRRIDDFGRYGHLTIEAIGNSVGFRSANAFRTNFKRRTGLAPSTYMEMSRKGN